MNATIGGVVIATYSNIIVSAKATLKITVQKLEEQYLHRIIAGLTL